MATVFTLTGVQEILEGIKTIIAEHGWAVINTEDDDDQPLAYTVGLWCTFGHPEIVATGLTPLQAGDVLNAAGELVRRGQHFEHGDESRDILIDLPVMFIGIAGKGREWIGAAMRLEEGFSALQLVWPDEQSRYPWADGWNGGEQRMLRETGKAAS